MKIRITQYGYPSDPYWDTNTKFKKLGAWDNTLTEDACALTDEARRVLGAVPLDWCMITFPDGRTMKRQFQDRAPESEARLDLYMPNGYDPSIPDYAEVELVRKAGRVEGNGMP